MLFMAIGTWEPDKRDKIVERRTEKEMMFPKEVKVIGQWAALGGGRGFTLIEVTDTMAAFAATRAWSDLMTMEVVPVLDIDEVMKALKSR